MKNIYKIIIVIILFVSLGAIYGLMNNDNEVLEEIRDLNTRLVMDDRFVDDIDVIVVGNGEIYLPLEFIKNELDSNIELGEEAKYIYLSLKNREYMLENEELTNYVKENTDEINIQIKYIDGTRMLPTKTISKLLNINIKYIEDTDLVIIEKYSDEIRMGRVIVQEASLNANDGFSSYDLSPLIMGDEVRIYSETDDKYWVRTEEGILGSIDKNSLEQYTKQPIIDNKINKVRRSFNIKDKINITWEHVYHSSPNISGDEKIEGLDVICPTWFSVKENGVVENKADMNYVKEAHDKGYKVWGLVDNSFDPKLTSEILNDKEVKDRVISQIVLYSSLYDLDGINIDFENIYYDDKQALVEFVEDLTHMLKKQNLIVSIDVTVPGGSKQWSQVYDREKLGKIVDYVALMAYDEHWGTSPVSGSVASIGWVERGIKESLEYIPKEKLLLGVPFYTRVWKEVTDEDGNVDVSSKAVPIKNVQEILDKNNAETVWDDEIGQYFATYEGEENTVYKVWIEDSKSMELKVNLAHKYNLKGIASWRKGYEYNEIWEVIKTFKENKKLI